MVATVVSFTPLGWVMGFGLAVAIYVDDRMAEEPNRAALLAAPAAAVGSSVVASLSGAFRTMPTVDPVVVAALGVLALIAVLREPLEPGVFRRQPNQEVHQARPASGGTGTRRHPRLPRRGGVGGERCPPSSR